MLQVRNVNFGSFCAAGGERRFFTTPRSINDASDGTHRAVRSYKLWVHVVSSVRAYIAVHGFHLGKIRRENFQLQCHCNYTLRSFSESRS